LANRINVEAEIIRSEQKYHVCTWLVSWKMTLRTRVACNVVGFHGISPPRKYIPTQDTVDCIRANMILCLPAEVPSGCSILNHRPGEDFCLGW